MRKYIVVLATTALASTALLAVGVPSAEAASKLQITKVKYDSDGSDAPVTNKKLNDEWVRITNTDDRTRTLTHWTLRDASNHVYTFPTFTLDAGERVWVHTGSGTDTAHHLYQNRGYYVWNNTSDTAKLRNTSGTGGDTCSWTTSDDSPYYC
ncbi:lamin tail domain-containing protein [Spongisporangium articulatum]|uniref:Lamin tail domain-containing protein n=1 Tax=Spongisporangium articulatum TaxID=3362603 RepID=A0ABW8AIR3_9ACTN